MTALRLLPMAIALVVVVETRGDRAAILLLAYVAAVVAAAWVAERNARRS